LEGGQPLWMRGWGSLPALPCRSRCWNFKLGSWGAGLNPTHGCRCSVESPCHQHPCPSSCCTMQGLCHALLLDAGSGEGAATRFVGLITQLPAHFGGDHTGCTFHPARVCDGGCNAKGVPCPRRVCACGNHCLPDNLQCRGRPQDATCCAAKQYKSKLPPVTCPYHLQRIRDEVQVFVEHASSLLVEEAGVGRVQTCKNECLHFVQSNTLAKGSNIVSESAVVGGWERQGVVNVTTFFFCVAKSTAPRCAHPAAPTAL